MQSMETKASACTLVLPLPQSRHPRLGRMPRMGNSPYPGIWFLGNLHVCHLHDVAVSWTGLPMVDVDHRCIYRRHGRPWPHFRPVQPYRNGQFVAGEAKFTGIFSGNADDVLPSPSRSWLLRPGFHTARIIYNNTATDSLIALLMLACFLSRSL